jgi:multiple sugar transport system ATP-binding protein
VFLFDEPLSNLDAKLRVQMRAEIALLHQRLNTTVIYVTHDQVEAMTLGQRIVLMDRGVVQQVDTPMKIYKKPANRFVASFIGSPAMNFFAGHVAGQEFHFTSGGKFPLVDALPDGPATLGVRPEDLLTNGDGMPLAMVTLDVVEHMGHETMIYFKLADSQQATSSHSVYARVRTISSPTPPLADATAPSCTKRLQSANR